MKVGVIGSGYVGLVAGACLAESGNDVVCADIDEAKIARLNDGEVPIYEPGLEPLIERNLEAGRLTFTTDVPAAVKASHIIFIAVGTPPGEDGSADLQHVLAVAKTIGESMDGEKIVITKSTVPVGTARMVREAIEAETDHTVHVCSNPEFLKEGAAVEDFMKPDRVVIGVDSDYAAEVLSDLYEPFVRTGHPVMFMDVPAAEITKYAANAMLATRISFMNSIARLCEETGADVNAVRKGVGSDRRIGPSFLFPGAGYGGSCLEGSETVLVRDEWGTRLMRLDALFRECVPAPESMPGEVEPEAMWVDDLDVLSWGSGDGTRWAPMQFVTRRWYEGEILTVRTKLGRRVTCTPDHPFVVSDGQGGPVRVKPAEELYETDWLPLSFGTATGGEESPRELAVVGELSSMGFEDGDVIARLDPGTHEGLELDDVRTAVVDHPRGRHRAYDILRAGALRLDELRSLGRACNYTQRLPDVAWDLTEEEQIALLSGLWHGDGSWSYVAGGPSVVLEWGTVSRELADGVVRMLGSLGIGSRLKVGRTAKSTTDTYWVVVSGADQVERLIDFVKPADRDAVLASIGRQAKRIAPTGYRPTDDAAWVRVVDKESRPFRGWVYSVEVPSIETFVTTAGLTVHNCFPKDVKALVRTMNEHGVDSSILQSVEDVNEAQKKTLLERLVDRLGDDLSGKTVAVWGLSFKPNTDDMREAPSLVTIDGLLERGARVVAHDPVAMDEARHHLGDRIEYVEINYDALDGAEALIIHTEWQPYRNPDFGRMRDALARPLILDGRNLWDPEDMAAQGFEYVSIGRSPVLASDAGTVRKTGSGPAGS